jgi:hypothetical protein
MLHWRCGLSCAKGFATPIATRAAAMELDGTLSISAGYFQLTRNLLATIGLLDSLR